MKQYLLSIYQPDGDGTPPPPEFLEPVMRNVEALNAELRAAGAWVFAAGLNPSGTATVLRPDGDGLRTTEGPFVDGTTHLGGFTIIQAPDVDTALVWGGKLARATTLPVEVREMQFGSRG